MAVAQALLAGFAYLRQRQVSTVSFLEGIIHGLDSGWASINSQHNGYYGAYATYSGLRFYPVNFLAHSLFARGDSERIAGQFCGDFSRGTELKDYSENIRVGILMHRHIDAYTDSHTSLTPIRNLFPKPHRRFAGIITDVLFDHFIADDWQAHSSDTFDVHIELIHRALTEHKHQLPAKLNKFAAFLKSERIFESYLTFEGVELTLERLSHRSSRFAPLAGSAALAHAHIDELKVGFDEFFPELKRFVADVRPDVARRAAAMV